jgi:phosphatidylserine decarboxylase
MATIETTAARKFPFTNPTSIQPGGGFCMGLELAWGRLRRAVLRRFRPGYVRAMADRRQGHCPNCPHDIIDPRDLKFYRNVCGYWFRDEDDRFRWRGRLGLARAGLAEVLFFSFLFLFLGLLFAAAAVVIHWAFWLPVPVILALCAEVIWFFRDPHRVVPTDPAAVVSPADGTITHVDEVDDPDFPGGRAFRIGIFLSIFNVHVNRIPRAGRVEVVRYLPGEFLDARHPECPVRNEQLWIDLEEPATSRRFRIKQISGAIARRIVCWLKVGEEVQTGDRLGMIKFGSRTELVMPAGLPMDVQVKVGYKVKGGSTTLLRFLS